MNWVGKAVLVGDFNFSDNWKENQVFPKQYDDLYMKIHKKARPTMLKTPKYSEWRPDHVLAKGCNIEKSKIEIIGDFSIPPYQNEPI